MQTVTHGPDGSRIFHGNGRSTGNYLRIVYYQGMVYRVYPPQYPLIYRTTYVYRGTDPSEAREPVTVITNNPCNRWVRRCVSAPIV